MSLYEKEREEHKVKADKLMAEGAADEWHTKNEVRIDHTPEIEKLKSSTTEENGRGIQEDGG